ncbi:MAG TPA: glycerophosphodiester phosphodiesterase family protein [Pseudorhizobium sp.]|nr:glycerophosphodiester phosphodiesterase family protein [Pseudorhizobium sp.]
MAVALWAWNSALLVNAPDAGRAKLISHRGVHQTFSSEDLQNDTCTAERIHPPTHNYIENTIPSMQAAFEYGADVVELDIHLTPDGEFAVFHDWTLDCRTDGQGVTGETDTAELKTLDIGYGYTADGGRSFPLRGKGTGLLPTLDEVLEEFPTREFLINFKSERQEEALALTEMLKENPARRDAIFGVYGGSIPTQEALRLIPGLRGYDKNSALSCLSQYLAIGWTGIVPSRCKGTLVIVPANYAWLMWGWPHRFTYRMREAGSAVILLGPYGGGGFTSGIDRTDQVHFIPERFGGYVWTNRIEVLGPMINGN